MQNVLQDTLKIYQTAEKEHLLSCEVDGQWDLHNELYATIHLSNVKKTAECTKEYIKTLS